LTGLAGSAADVLIHGETGTGKELVARCLHDLSARRQRQFRRHQLRRLAETLFDSEIFGHEPGAFTGAQQTAHRQDRARQRRHAVPR
jgi:two-component system response regulator AauR